MATSVRTVGDVTRRRKTGESASFRGAGGGTANEDKIIELLGVDGVVTRICQHPDGTIEIHTAAMSASGHAVRVPSTGSVTAFATDSGPR
jgi:hypothetical protein